MEICIKSKQIYEEHEDEIIENHVAEIIYLDEGFKMIYDDTSLYFDGESLSLTKTNMNLEIKVGSRCTSKVTTPYGDIPLDVEGKDINFCKTPFKFDVRYLIKIGNTKEYINELQIYDTCQIAI